MEETSGLQDGLECCPNCRAHNSELCSARCMVKVFQSMVSVHFVLCRACGMRGPIGSGPDQAREMWNNLSQARWAKDQEMDKISCRVSADRASAQLVPIYRTKLYKVVSCGMCEKVVIMEFPVSIEDPLQLCRLPAGWEIGAASGKRILGISNQIVCGDCIGDLPRRGLSWKAAGGDLFRCHDCGRVARSLGPGWYKMASGGDYFHYCPDCMEGNHKADLEMIRLYNK